MRSGGTRGIKREREKLPQKRAARVPRPRRDAHGPARDAAATPVPAPQLPSRARLWEPGVRLRSLWGCAAGYGAPAAAARAGAWRSPRGRRRSRWSGAYRRGPGLAGVGTRCPLNRARGYCEVTPRRHPSPLAPSRLVSGETFLSFRSLGQM